MITSERVLTACIMAERCGFDKTKISRFIGMVQAARNDRHIMRSPDYSIGLLDVQGKPYTTDISIKLLANTLHFIQLFDSLHVRLSMHRDDSGNFTGLADITTLM